MASESCVISPRLKSGEPSPLFSRLKEFFGNRSKAVEVYAKAKSKDFSKVFPDVAMDDNGEPVFEDLVEKCCLKTMLDEQETLSRLNRENRISGDTNYRTVKEIQKKAVNFNKSHVLNSDYAATLQVEGNKSSLKIVPKREISASNLKKMEVNYKLNERLENLLTEWGIGIGALTELEERQGMNGVTDFNVALNSAEGIKEVIRLAKGERGRAALPEEFAHFAVEAIGEVPLRTRVLNVLSNEEVLKRIFGEQYNDYYTLYSGNIELMANEALGKLVASALNDAEIFNPNKALFNRYLKQIKDEFSKHSTDEIDDIINQVITDVYGLANDIVNNRYELKTSNIRFRTRLAQLSDTASREEKLLEKIIESELKRLKIYGDNQEFKNSQEELVNQLVTSLRTKQSIAGILNYVNKGLGDLKKLANRLDQSTTSGNIRDKCKALRNIRNYVSSYGSIIVEIKKSMHEARREGDTTLVNTLGSILSECTELVGQLTDDFYAVAKESFADFIRPFVDERMAAELANPIQGRATGVITAEALIESLDHDIGIVDRWVDSMANSTDTLLQIYDQIVKKQKGLARLDTLEIKKQVEKKTRELELSGVKDTDWMYERDSSGNLTGRFIKEYDDEKFYEAKNQFAEYLDRKYGIGINVEKIREMNDWNSKNTIEKDGIRVPNSNYANSAYTSLNSAQKEYYHFILDLKEKLDRVLPNSEKFLAPQIRRGFLERAMSKSNKVKYFWESLKDLVVRREDETSMGGTSEYNSTIIDFEGNEVMKLPIYYTRRLEDMGDLSTDVASTMIAYAAMANDFNRMNEVIDTLEVGRILLNEREVTQTEGDKPKKETFSRMGIKVSNLLSKKGGATMFMQKLNTFMEMQVYGRQQQDEGTLIGNVDTAKAANLLNKLTSYGTTALSLLTGVANLTQNIANAGIESISNRYFNKTELKEASWEYGKLLPGFLSEVGSRIKTNKLSLFSELFNVSQDYRHGISNVEFNKKTKFSQLMGENALFITTQAGDHATQHIIAIALALRKPMMYNGKQTNLWEVLEVEYLDPSNPNLGARLVIKKGATKTDGKEFTSEDIIKFSNKVRGVENTLYGIYNSEDKNALQQRAAGRIIYLFRNWMRPLYLNRFGKANYSFDTGEFGEGYFRTGAKFLFNTLNNLRKLEFYLVKQQWERMSSQEKSNIWRCLTELGIYWSTFILLNMLQGMKDWDDDDKPHPLRLLGYSLARLKTDTGALLPSPTMLDEGVKLFTSPFAALSYIKKLRKLLDLINPVVILGDKNPYTTEVRSGIYKGFTKAESYGIDLFPFIRQVVNALDPDEPARWFK